MDLGTSSVPSIVVLPGANHEWSPSLISTVLTKLVLSYSRARRPARVLAISDVFGSSTHVHKSLLTHKTMEDAFVCRFFLLDRSRRDGCMDVR
jgi:hypothetical protein